MKQPEISPGARVLPGAVVRGQVSLGEESCIWYNAVVRGDIEQISIGARTNIQDCCVLHADAGFPVSVGDGVTVGHGAILHGCTVGDNTLVGMGAVILNGAKVGKNCLIAAGALVPQGGEIPDGSLALGQPAKVMRSLMPSEIEHNAASATHYARLAAETEDP